MASARRRGRRQVPFEELERLERLQRRLRALIDENTVEALMVAADEFEQEGFMELAEYYRERARLREEEINARVRSTTQRDAMSSRTRVRGHRR